MKDSSKIIALLDIGAEINVITRKLMEEVNLAMKKESKVELILYTGHNWRFLGLCEDVEIAIRGLKTRHPIFVVEAEDYDLILGQPFLNSVKFSQEYKPDGILGTIMHRYRH